MKKNLGTHKTPEQVEFTDIASDLIARYGFNKSRVGALCRVSPAAVSMIFNGQRSPGPAVLEILRREYEDLTNPGGHKPRKAEPKDQVFEDLLILKDQAPESFKIAKATISALKAHALKNSE